MCIYCSGKLFTEPLPNNYIVVHIQIRRLVGGIYEVRRWDGLRCHDMHTKFHKNCLRHSKVIAEVTQKQHWYHISLLLVLNQGMKTKNWLILLSACLCVCMCIPLSLLGKSKLAPVAKNEHATEDLFFLEWSGRSWSWVPRGTEPRITVLARANTYLSDLIISVHNFLYYIVFY
jgi:hypothetical protein